MQKLQNHDGSGLVTIPKRFLERDGLVSDSGQPKDGRQLTVDRLDDGFYAVRFCDGDVPELSECEVVQRLAAHQALQQDLQTQRAD